MKIHNLIRTNKSSLHDKCPKNKSKYDRASSVVEAWCSFLFALPPPSMQPSLVGGYVRGSRG
jgi:hypothetical protein